MASKFSDLPGPDLSVVAHFVLFLGRASVVVLFLERADRQTDGHHLLMTIYLAEAWWIKCASKRKGRRYM